MLVASFPNDSLAPTVFTGCIRDDLVGNTMITLTCPEEPTTEGSPISAMLEGEPKVVLNAAVAWQSQDLAEPPIHSSAPAS